MVTRVDACSLYGVRLNCASVIQIDHGLTGCARQ